MPARDETQDPDNNFDQGPDPVSGPSQPAARGDEPNNLPPSEVVQVLTWQVLLSKWVAFAQQAVGLSNQGAQGRLKQSVADIVGLQAVWFALSEWEQLPASERPLALDRAAVLVERHRTSLERIWSGETVPEDLQSLVDDAVDRLAAVQKH